MKIKINGCVSSFVLLIDVLAKKVIKIYIFRRNYELMPALKIYYDYLRQLIIHNCVAGYKISLIGIWWSPLRYKQLLRKYEVKTFYNLIVKASSLSNLHNYLAQINLKL